MMRARSKRLWGWACGSYARPRVRCEKANPPRGGGAKPMGLSSREVAGLPNGGGTHYSSPKERATPYKRKEWGTHGKE